MNETVEAIKISTNLISCVLFFALITDEFHPIARTISTIGWCIMVQFTFYMSGL
jgi:hypothetical protein